MHAEKFELLNSGEEGWKSADQVGQVLLYSYVFLFRFLLLACKFKAIRYRF